MSSIFANLSVSYLVETGSAVYITTSCILLLVIYFFPSIPLYYFIGTVSPSHWKTWRLKSDGRHSCNIRPCTNILSYTMTYLPSLLSMWKRCNIILLIEISAMQNIILISFILQYSPTAVLYSNLLDFILRS